jgi:hypothetical protein
MSAALRIDSPVFPAAVRASKSAWVPASLLNAAFAPASVLVLVVYITLRWTKFPGVARRWSIKATNAELVAATGLSPRTIERAMSWLREHHWLRETVAMPGRSPKRYLVLPPGQYVLIPAQLVARVPTAGHLRVVGGWLWKRIGDVGDVGWVLYTQREFAKLLGIRPATLSRLIGDLDEAGVMTVKLRPEHGAPWALQIPSAPAITQDPCAAVRKRLAIAEERATPVLPSLVRQRVSCSSRRGFDAPDDGRRELRKRPSTCARVRPRSSSSSPPTEEREHLDEQVVDASCEPQVVEAPTVAALRADPRDVAAVIAGLPESLRSSLPPTLPRRVVALIGRTLRARTAADLVERAHRRWVGGGFSGQELRDGVGVLVSLLAARCGDERCEDGRIVDGGGREYGCRSCGLWGPAEGAARDVDELPPRERWRPRGALFDWRASLDAVRAVPRPAHADWRQLTARRV